MSDEIPEGFSEVPPGSEGFGYTSTLDTIEKHGLGSEDYEQMLVKQDNRCAICCLSPASVGPLKIDHDHDNGAVRGLLCRSCNLGLGHFKDDPYLLDDARKYLFEYGCHATREVARLDHEMKHPETAKGTTSLELHFLDGSLGFGAIAAMPRLGLNGQTFDKYGREWRISERRPMPPESGRGAEYLVCYEVGP
jgi:Recombination endonuclease VII